METTAKQLLEQEVDEIKSDLKLLFQQQHVINEQITRANERLKVKRDQYFDLLLAAGEVDWAYLLDVSNETQRVHRECQNRLQAIGLMSSGYNSDVMQRVVQIALIKNDPNSLESIFNGLTEVLPFLKPIKGAKHIAIMERSLHAYGSSYFLHLRGNKFTLIERSYNRNQSLKSFDDLRSALEYVQSNFYYKDALAEKRSSIEDAFSDL